jgi:hypothetical protein
VPVICPLWTENREKITKVCILAIGSFTKCGGENVEFTLSSRGFVASTQVAGGERQGYCEELEGPAAADEPS